MNESAATQYKQIVYRRLAEPVDLFGFELPSQLWLVLLAIILVAAFFYTGWMYLRDSRSVGPWWASLLGLLRASVYVLLAWVFLLRAEQTWEERQTHSKVVVGIDVTGSMGTIDDVPTGRSGEKLFSRQEKVLELLTGKKSKFLAALEAVNPVTLHRFGVRLDENYLLFRDGRDWTRAEWEDPNRDDKVPANTPPPQPVPLAPEFWKAFLMPSVKVEPLADWPAAQKERFSQLLTLNKKLGESGMFSGTDVGDSVLGLVNRELNNMVQGIIIVSDGRSTEGSPQAYRDLEARAKAAHIPIFVVAVGDDRPQVRIEVADLRVPDLVQPEDKFRAVAEVTGEGLAEQKVDVELELTHVRKDAKGKEQLLEIALIEAEDRNDPSKQRMKLILADRKPLLLKPSTQPVFDRSNPPRLTAEFPIDAAALAAAAGQDLTRGDFAGKKWEIAESSKDGEYRFVARVPRDKMEAYTRSHHTSEPAPLHVIKKPLRVLLFASAPTHDYQFVRTLLVREKEKVELSIHLQLPPGRTERRVGVVQDVDPERLLSEFPTRLETGNKEDRLYALDEYDVIVAFDPDWTKLTEKQLKLLETWVDKGGGLIVEGGPINTLQLARPGSYKNQLKPLLDMLPVVLRDVRIDDLDRSTADPWPLSFEGATPDLEFLKLDESDPNIKFLEDWDEFFYGPRKEGEPKVLQRGFYNYYPVDAAKTGAHVVARFTDPRARLKDGSQQPFLVLSDPASHRRVVWLGWGETRRLRQYREAYFERFWTKILRYAAAGHLTQMNKRMRLEMSSTYVANKFVEVEAKIEGRGGEPLPRDARPPEITLTLPDGVPEKEVAQPVLMKAKPGGDGWFAARFQVRSPGNYKLHVKVPDTGDSQSRPFAVKEANPEMDNVRPDFEQLYRLASEADEVLDRMRDEEKQELKKHLQRPRPAEVSDAKPRLYFDLNNAHLIPSCMRKVVNNNRSRGPIQDQWDDGVTLWEREPPLPPVKLSYVLLAAVGLLSVEWLIRKLLRLA
jgi:hypothetical protein